MLRWPVPIESNGATLEKRPVSDGAHLFSHHRKFRHVGCTILIRANFGRTRWKDQRRNLKDDEESPMKTSVLALLAVATITLAALPEAAQATCPAPCPANSVCVWQHANFKGARKVYRASDATYTDDRYDGTTIGVNDSVSSVCNNIPSGANATCLRFFWHSNYKFLSFGISPGGYNSDLTKSIWVSGSYYVFNDELSSHKTTSDAGYNCTVGAIY